MNKFIGNGANAGVDFAETTNAISSGAEVSVQHNCFAGSLRGLEVEKILDTASVIANFNDFSGVTTTGVNNVSGDPDHTIDAENNFLGALATKSAGNVDVDPELASPPDDDADGVLDCADLCPATRARTPPATPAATAAPQDPWCAERVRLGAVTAAWSASC